MTTKAELKSLAKAVEEVGSDLSALTQKHPLAILSGAIALGFSFGFFGAFRIIQIGMALKLQEKFLPDDILKNLPDKNQIQQATAHA